MSQFNVNNEIEKANKYQKKGNFDQAIKIYENIIVKYPKNTRASKALKEIKNNSLKSNLDSLIKLFNEKKFQEANKQGENLLKTYKDNHLLYNILGAINCQLNLFDSAVHYYNKSIEINPNYAPSHSNLGATYKVMKKYDLALNSYDSAIQIDPNFTEAYNNIGLLLKQFNKLDDALKYFIKAFEIDNNNVLPLNNIGLIYKDKKEYQKSISLFDKAISLQPNYYEAYSNRGNTKSLMGDFDGAISDFKQALKINKDSPEVNNNLGSALNEKGLSNEALPFLFKAVELNPNYSDAYNNLGIASEYLKKREDALVYFKKALELDPNHSDAHTFLSYHYFANEEFVKFQEGYRHRLFKNNSLQHVPLNKTKPFYELETIKDKNIVIYDEQGIGDEISFIGLLDDFKKNISNNITIVCSERAKDIFNISLKDTQVFTRKEIDRVVNVFDCEMPMGSLLEYVDFKNTKIFPLNRYLKPSKVLKDFWFEQLKSVFKGKVIGICWKGGNTSGQLKKRSLGLKDIMINLPENGNYVNLQYGSVEKEIEEVEKLTGRKIINFSDVVPTEEIDNQFAIMSNLDHVITVQGTTVHMTGSLSVPTTCLLSVSPDFRYFNDGKDSFFWKSVKFIRQKVISDWDPVLLELKKEFKNFFDK